MEGESAHEESGIIIIARFKGVKVLVTQLCLTLCHPVNCRPPGSSIHEILQARILAWVAMPFYKGSSQPRDWIGVSRIAERFFTIWANGETFNLPSRAWHRAPKSLDFPMMSSITASWGNLRLRAGCQGTNQVMRGLKLSVLTLSPLWGGWRRWRLNQLSVANDLIIYGYVKKRPQNLRRTEIGELLGCCTCGDVWMISLERAWKHYAPFPMPCPMQVFYLPVPELYPFTTNQ